jgi:lipid A 3-O-deacylase
MRPSNVVTILALMLAVAARARAQDLTRAVTVTAENDYFDFWLPPDQRPDNNYTQGARISAEFTAVPTLLRRLTCQHRIQLQCGTALEIGQDIYTPTHDAVNLLPRERPYAGWLYLRASTEAATEGRRLMVDGILGVTGPASLAGQTQIAFHKLIPDFRRPLGWALQIPTEPDFALRAEDAWYVAAPGAAHNWADVVPETHATIGTLRTALGAGGRARVGFGLTHPWLVDASARPWEAYLFLGGNAEGVARDLFLDGGTFTHSAHVTRERLIGDWERGIGIRLWRLGLEYRAVTQAREYRTGPATHPFGGITLTWWTRR